MSVKIFYTRAGTRLVPSASTYQMWDQVGEHMERAMDRMTTDYELIGFGFWAEQRIRAILAGLRSADDETTKALTAAQEMLALAYDAISAEDETAEALMMAARQTLFDVEEGLRLIRLKVSRAIAAILEETAP